MPSNTLFAGAARRMSVWPASPAWPLALCATTVLLAACGGSDTATSPTPPAEVAISGAVVDGPLQGATVCLDLNDNSACDAGEPQQTATDADGKYSFMALASLAGAHSVVAVVPATAIDKDTGAAVGAAFTLKAPPSGSSAAQSVFVSPLTTVVAETASATGSTVAEASAAVQAQLGLAVSPLTDFTAVGADPALAVAARALGQVVITTARLAADAGVAPATAAKLVRDASLQQLPVLANALAAAPAEASMAERAAAAVLAVAEALNLSSSTVAAVAEQVAKPAGVADAAGPFISVRRFAYSDANNYSYQLFSGDSTQTNASGAWLANEARANLGNGEAIAFSRNQLYWTGSAWNNCDDGHAMVATTAATATTPQKSLYCGAARSESRLVWEDIAGQTLRAVLTRMRAFPLRDNPGSTTDADGLPVKWGPDPALLPADAVFPAGSRYNMRAIRNEIGNTDRIETAVKPTVRRADGSFRQAVTLEQLGLMAGDLAPANAGVVVSNLNTLFVADVPLASQADATLEPLQRWRLAVDVAGLKGRFYRCEVLKSNNASRNCETVGDATLATPTQGGIRLLRVASGYPVALKARLQQQRFWAEYAGTVFRGTTDLERTYHHQRLNGVAWTSLRTALGIPAHTEPAAPAASGPFEILRSFSFSNLANYSWRTFSGDDSITDANGTAVAVEQRKSVAGGVEQPQVGNRSYWTGSAWYDCPSSGATVTFSVAPPNASTYCKTYVEERVLPATLVLSLGGRLMGDVVNEIRSYNSLDSGSSYANWGPSPAANPQLASTRFPAGATMEHRGLRRVAASWTIATAPTDQVRVAPEPNTSAPFSSWPFASTLEDMVAKYPGSLAGNSPNGSTTLFVGSYTEPASDAAFTNVVEIRVAFDANGNKARFTRNNRLVSNGFTTNYATVLDTTYSIETLADVRLLKFAAMPDGFEARLDYSRQFAERNGGVWYAYNNPPQVVNWSIRLNGPAKTALFTALGIQ